MTIHTVSRTINGQPFSIETGRMAKQADGAVVVRMGDTMVLVAVVAAQKKTDRDFFPLTVEYREKFYASGRIPGGFFKREGRPGERETLTARLIDRPIRPLFDKHFMTETQVIATPISYDGVNAPDVISLVGASAALALSDIPFDDFVSGVRVGRIEGQFIVNPTTEQIEASDIDVIVAGTDTGVMMVEGGCSEVSEEDMLAAVRFGHDEIKQLNALQRDLKAKAGGKTKRVVEVPERLAELDGKIAKDFSDRIGQALFVAKKLDRQDALKAIQQDALAKYQVDYPEKEAYVALVLEEIEKKLMRDMILDKGKRLDGRGSTDIRPITGEVGVLPRAHGSALFTRGETQSLVTTTLGTTEDEQMLDTIEGESWKRYMLHYNFPAFSVGEVGRFGGPGRREIGHGALAERALRPMIPPKTEFPYTIRIVSEILESNGSSSMASVCGGSLSLMDGGVPMKKPVAGIAMGLVIEDERVAVLSDILGAEDHLGDMDFKVTGTADGITAFQLDTKIAGISDAVMMKALAQAKVGRLHILNEMNKTLAQSRADISPFAPKVTTIQIPVDKIREIIGPGGKIVKRIQEESGAKIEIEDDGTVRVIAVNTEAAEIALGRIREITAEPEVGKVYEGEVRSILAFGAFVQIMPGRDGLLHISEIAHRRLERVEDELQVGDIVKVKVLEVQPDGKVRLSRKILLEKPEGYQEEERSERPHRSSGDRDHGRSSGGGRRHERSRR